MADHPDAKLLHDILAALRGIRDEIHAISEKQKTTEHKNKEPTQIEITAQPGLPVSISKYYESQNTGWKAKWEKIKVAFEIAAFAGAVVAGIYTVRTFNQIKKQADVAYTQWQDLRHNFQVEQRAWVKIDYGFPHVITTDTTAAVSVRYFNVGKSPALDVEILTTTQIVNNLTEPSFVIAPGKSQSFSNILFSPGDSDAPPVFAEGSPLGGRKFTTDEV
jgi:hypothetical protein